MLTECAIEPDIPVTMSVMETGAVPGGFDTVKNAVLFDIEGKVRELGLMDVGTKLGPLTLRETVMLEDA
jgi:hypothetical protein